MRKKIRIGNRVISESSPTFIIGELSCNHNQNFELALETIDKMHEAGVDCVKIQTSKPGGITLDSDQEMFKIKGGLWDGKRLFDLYKEVYTPWEWIKDLKEYSEARGMEFFSSPFDLEAVDYLEDLDMPAYKIASFEIQDIPLISKVAKLGKPIIISTGIATKEDIELALETCIAENNDQVILLKCTSAYPTPFSEVNLQMINKFREDFDCLVGLSDHTLGDAVAKSSVVLGAKVIEKHFIADRNIGGPDAAFSMEPEEFKSMINGVRDVELIMGKVSYELSEKVIDSRKYGRSLFISSDVRKGDVVSEKNIKSVRPSNGLHPKHYKSVLGKVFSKDYKTGTPLTFEKLEK